MLIDLTQQDVKDALNQYIKAKTNNDVNISKVWFVFENGITYHINDVSIITGFEVVDQVPNPQIVLNEDGVYDRESLSSHNMTI